ncbi:ATP-dependent zinc protease [bacterium]|nr:ATP-dependent zinc protease [bacterium]NBX97647.1 ATP-dependent zinc protease [bacterium]NDC94584.1 ATP-dependent zinc protease [bacterium]NDD84164.1 ATP-dependent zinc protease [bacterium]NDG29957.1 ATP-dependent zinc protease [bacterium]
MAKFQIIIGRAEQIDIVGTALGVPARIDTGAFRSSIHATDIKEITKDGVKQLQFSILGHTCAPVARKVVATKYNVVTVRSSNGEVSDRYAVTFKVKIGPKIFNTSFSLSDRSQNVFPILVGREALNGRFIVDSNKTSVSKVSLVKQFGIALDNHEGTEE